MSLLSRDDIGAFQRDGYLLIRGLAPPELLTELRSVALDHCRQRIAPFELETEVQYPGAPAFAEAEGGDTLRRLLMAWSRHPVFKAWGEHPGVTGPLAQLLPRGPLYLSQSHHNCIMTKMPRFSSRTGWHRDVRYWSFAGGPLVTAWLALGPEVDDNGAVHLIPGSHRLALGRERLDDRLFLREDRDDNRALIDRAIVVELSPGDVLLFHAASFHAAGPNRTDHAKLAVVYTYHDQSTVPLPDSKSSRFPEVDVTPDDRARPLGHAGELKSAVSKAAP